MRRPRERPRCFNVYGFRGVEAWKTEIRAVHGYALRGSIHTEMETKIERYALRVYAHDPTTMGAGVLLCQYECFE